VSVSVVIPNRNNAPYLAGCIASVADDAAVEQVIVVDDASSDGSADLVRELGHPKTILITNERNVGATRARHQAVATASADYLAFIDGDDFVEPGTLTSCLRPAEQDGLDMALAATATIDARTGETRPFLPAPRSMSGEDALIETLGGWGFDPRAGIFRRDLYLEAVRGFSFYGYSDDELLTRRIVRAAGRIGGAEGMYYYRVGHGEPEAEQQVMRLLTHAKSIALALSVQRADWTRRLQDNRNQVIRAGFTKLLRKQNGTTAPILREVLEELVRADLPWSARDLPYRAALAAWRAGVHLGR
jgi:glycosyltransferase involved in cell wall biosynthesis